MRAQSLCGSSVSRRSIVKAATLGLALSGAGGVGWRSAAAQDAAPPANAITPDEALARLVEGNARYAANTSRNKDFSAGRAARAKAQYPIATIVSCADSRLAPELAFDQAPGDIFVVRVAGNFVNDDGLASLEFGVQFLGIPLILVLGHSGCGAIAATIRVIQEGITLPGHLPGLVEGLKPGVQTALDRGGADMLADATLENVRANVARLMTAEPIVGPAVAAGTVRIAGGVYDIATGTVSFVPA